MCGFIAIFTVLLATYAYGAPQAADNLACEHSTVDNSFFIDSSFPRLSWIPETSDRGQVQTAYQIVMATTNDVANCAAVSSCVWDSGVVTSNSTMVQYSGPALQDDTTYFFTVVWWDATGTAAPVSQNGECNVAIVTTSLWQDAVWIGLGDLNVMRREIVVPAGVVQARAYVCALGWGQFYVNGILQDVGTLGVGWTKYSTRSLYLPYDVTTSLTTGSNVIGAMIGHGWKNTESYPPQDPEYADSNRILKMILIVTFTNGTKSVIANSDSNWLGTQSPILYDCIYNGETYDASLEQPGWSTLSFSNVSAWSPVPVYTLGNWNPILNVQSFPPIMVVREVSPVAITEPVPGHFVVDFGENLSGYCRINATGPAGTNITLHHAEVLMHPPYGPSNGLPYYGNLRTALAADTYLMKGLESGETYTPRFTYHGFRYVEVTGYPGTLTAGDIVMLHVRTNLLPRASFNSSSLILNQIQYNCVTGQGSNLMSVPTDCDQRDERLGWMGDAGLSADTMTLSWQVAALHENYLRNIVDEMDNTTYTIPDVVPFVRYGGRPADPSWSAAFPQITWSQFKYLGDVTVAQRYFGHVLDYLDDLQNQVQAAGGMTNWPTPYGDWVPANPNLKVTNPFCSGYNYLVTISQAMEFALALNDIDQYQQLQQLFEEVAAEFNSAFAAGDNYANGQQIAMALPLLIGIVPEAMNATALFESLISNIVDGNVYHVTLGIIGLKGLLPALSDGNRWDIATALAEQIDYPSLGFMAYNDQEPANGNIWELWNSPTGSDGMDSRNHHMFSSPSAWHYELAGFTDLRRTGLGPVVAMSAANTPALSSAAVSFAAPAGLLSFQWQRHGGVQCGKSPENQGLKNPALPLHVPLVIDCGSMGGVISAVSFASWGLPFGYCGNFEVNNSCNLANTTNTVQSICVGQQFCELPTTVDFWTDPCFGQIKRLYVEVQCSGVGAITATAVVPVNGQSLVTLPLYAISAADALVTESGTTIYSNGNFVPGVDGILSASLNTAGDAVTVTVTSGTYNFVLTSAN